MCLQVCYVLLSLCHSIAHVHFVHKGGKVSPHKPEDQKRNVRGHFHPPRANLRGDSGFIHTGGLPRGGLSFSPRVCGAQRSCPRTRPASFEVSFAWTGPVPALMSQRSSICFLWTTSMLTPTFHKVHYFRECPSFRYQHKLKSSK